MSSTSVPISGTRSDDSFERRRERLLQSSSPVAERRSGTCEFVDEHAEERRSVG
ncbi:hypothetical protein [Halogeometricum luteum]|uniref:Uncharacterized protein n=1 Tax=Halogeometricum luteum TaxID=2950537 RepID=A0ABU2G2S1_9EURY|nr:hypothetical protein [Halogeometricum sp. S3BR5-2]MDS0294786.1 hypothetical protein [Halogeometricum sp. S3BR5-2]